MIPAEGYPREPSAAYTMLSAAALPPLLNLKARQVEVYTLLKRREATRYGASRIFKEGQSVPVVIEGVEVGRIAVAEILPRDTSGPRPTAGGTGA